MNVLDSAQNLEIAGVKISARADRCLIALEFAGGAMDGKSHLHQVFDDHLNLLFSCGFLHCDNHRIGCWLLVVSCWRVCPNNQ